MSEAPTDRAIRRMQEAATTIHLERARLRGVLEALADVAGFPATIAALRTELENITARAEQVAKLMGQDK